MRPGRASRTAEHNALFRALAARRPADATVVDDQLAKAFISALPYRSADLLARSWPGREALVRFLDWRWPGVRTSVVARTRLVDDTIASVVETTHQVVILGAGFDTRAWRLACLDGVDVFEVDHPDTQQHKRALLGRLDLDRHDVRFVGTDFNLRQLATAMAEVGYQPTTPTLFLWEGVTAYLTAEAVDATMRWCAGTTTEPASHLIFTYVNQDLLTEPGRYHGTRRLLAALDRSDERLTFGLDPDETPAYLAARGLTLVSDLGAADYRARYYGHAARHMRGHEFYRVAHARIGG